MFLSNSVDMMKNLRLPQIQAAPDKLSTPFNKLPSEESAVILERRFGFSVAVIGIIANTEITAHNTQHIRCQFFCSLSIFNSSWSELLNSNFLVHFPNRWRHANDGRHRHASVVGHASAGAPLAGGAAPGRSPSCAACANHLRTKKCPEKDTFQEIP